MTFHCDPFLKVQCLWRGQTDNIWLWYLYPYQLPGRPSSLSLCFTVPPPSSGFCCCVAVQHQSSTDSLARLLGAHSSWLPYEHYQNLWYSSWTPRLVLFTYRKDWWAVKTLCYVKRGEWEFAHCSGKLMSPPSSAYTLCETRVKIFFDLVIVGITIGKWVHMNYWRVK